MIPSSVTIALPIPSPSPPPDAEFITPSTQLLLDPFRLEL